MSLRPSVHISKAVIDESLAQEMVQGKRALEPFHTYAKLRGLPIDLIEDTAFSGGVEIHRHEADVWFCMEGEATFVCDGTPKDPKIRVRDGVEDDREIRAAELTGATVYVLRAGDWLYIPAGQPHSHTTSTHARLIVIKVPESIVPLEECLKGAQ